MRQHISYLNARQYKEREKSRIKNQQHRFLVLLVKSIQAKSTVTTKEISFPQFCRAGCTHERSGVSPDPHAVIIHQMVRQAVRSLGRLRCIRYRTSTCRLSTRSSFWDLDLSQKMGRLVLGAASRLDAFSAYPFLT